MPPTPPVADAHDTFWLWKALEQSWSWIITVFGVFVVWLYRLARRSVTDEIANRVVEKLTTTDRFSGDSPLGKAIRWEIKRMSHHGDGSENL